jgi:hypothetical protein
MISSPPKTDQSSSKCNALFLLGPPVGQASSFKVNVTPTSITTPNLYQLKPEGQSPLPKPKHHNSTGLPVSTAAKRNSFGLVVICKPQTLEYFWASIISPVVTVETSSSRERQKQWQRRYPLRGACLRTQSPIALCPCASSSVASIAQGR